MKQIPMTDYELACARGWSVGYAVEINRPVPGVVHTPMKADAVLTDAERIYAYIMNGNKVADLHSITEVKNK